MRTQEPRVSSLNAGLSLLTLASVFIGLLFSAMRSIARSGALQLLITAINSPSRTEWRGCGDRGCDY